MAVSERNVKAMQLLSSFVRQDSDEREDSETQDGAANVHGEQISRPRHRQSFLDRTHTYSSLRWFAKPTWLSPLECARYGWENVEVDVLRCVSCKAHVSGRMPAAHNPKAFDECCQRISKSLREGHSRSCPWSSSPSPEYFLRLPYETRPKADRAFRQHFELLIQLGEQLPLLDQTVLDKMNLMDVQLKQIVHKYAGLCTGVSPEVARSAAILSLTGWMSSSSAVSAAMVHCSVCNRHVGMWNFLTLANPCVETVVTDVGLIPVVSTSNGHAITDGTDEESEGQHSPESSKQSLDSDPETNGNSIEAETEEKMDVDDKEMSETINTEAQETKSDETEVSKTENIQSEIQTTELASIEKPEDAKSETKDSQVEIESQTEIPETKPETDTSQTEISEKNDKKSEVPDTKATEVNSPLKSETDASETEASSPVAKDSDTKQDVSETTVPVSGADKSDDAAPQPSAGSDGESADRSQNESPVSNEQNSENKNENVEKMETGDNTTEEVSQSETSESTTGEEAGEAVQAEKRGSEADSEEPSAKRQKTTQQIVPVRRKHIRQTTMFGPLSEHHAWCPWVTVGDSSQQAGWRQVLYLLVPELSPEKNSSIPRRAHTSSPDVLRSIRRLFNEWTAPATTR